MKIVLFLFFAFIYCMKDCVVHTADDEQSSHTTPEASNPLSTAIPATQDDLDDISIQDILSSDIDASDKINKKIISAITEFLSNCNVYKQIELSMSKFVFPKNSIKVDLKKETATFYNFVIKEESDMTRNKRKSYVTLFGCDSSRKAKIEVTLPNNIRITANVKVESLNELVSRPTSEGSITILFKTNFILKKFAFQSNDSKHEDDITRKISYFKTEVSLDFDTKYQKAIYNNLEVFLNEVESPLEQFFVDELNKELTKNNISVGDDCSKFINIEKNSKRINSIFLKSDFNNLYVIPNVSLETWKGVGLSVGPIVIQGLSHFNSSELIVSGTKISNAETDGYYYSTPRPDDPEKKEATVRIKTNGLKGKLDWSYNSKHRSFPFFLDFIIFEVKKTKNFQYTNVQPSDNSGNDKSIGYSRSEQNKIDTEMYLGNMWIKSKASTSESEKEFVNSVLAEYLKTVLKDSLKKPIVENLQNNPTVVRC